MTLELDLTEVKESLKKALSGGVTLGLSIEPKSGTSSPQVGHPGATHTLVVLHHVSLGPHGCRGEAL